MKPTIGKTESGDLTIDIPRLLATRLLLQADSGGGKSWALKRVLEQTHGHVQQIILDPEGEFSTMREKFDYLLCAPEGADAIATPKTAAILARKLRETRVSAVIDIFDLRMQEQKHFVRLFIEELLAAPKLLWNPCLLVIDEAQIFAPEKDQAESLPAIMDLRGRGRKRGLCPILATPRLGQLSKDAAAGMQNKLIGVTTLDVDVARAARDLSLMPKDATELLRNLDPGEFFCFGPALTRTITKVKIGPIQTSHGQHTVGKDTRPPEPSEKIKSVIAKLTDLPKEAEHELRTLADLKAEVTKLRRELTIAKKENPPPPKVDIKTIEKPVVGIKAIAGIQKVESDMRKALKSMRAVNSAVEKLAVAMEQQVTKLSGELQKVTNSQSGSHAAALAPRTVQPGSRSGSAIGSHNSGSAHGGGNGAAPSELGEGERKMLIAIAQCPDGATREQLTILTGYKRSTRDAYIQRLGNKGLIQIGGKIYASEQGIATLGNDFQPLPTGSDLRRYWLERLPEGERRIFERVIEHGQPQEVDRDSLNDLGFARSSRDAYLQRLAARQLVKPVGRGAVKASEILFD